MQLFLLAPPLRNVCIHPLHYVINFVRTILNTESFISEVEEEQIMEARQPQWAKLPNKLWQLIFQRVPLLDLVTTGRRVCQRWNQIISDENVSPLYRV